MFQSFEWWLAKAACIRGDNGRIVGVVRSGGGNQVEARLMKNRVPIKGGSDEFAKSAVLLCNVEERDSLILWKRIQ